MSDVTDIVQVHVLKDVEFIALGYPSVVMRGDVFVSQEPDFIAGAVRYKMTVEWPSGSSQPKAV